MKKAGLIFLFFIAGESVLYIIFLLDVPVMLIFLKSAADFYFLLVAAHLLGRFYWRYQERIGWDI